ncbi:MAG: mannitol dehydrogenase family protein [Verrucomicrobiota bacterium JB023]|nr:mannitol dehydrogenase family protein [Verrucomicrobiota bacterium JB023]
MERSVLSRRLALRRSSPGKPVRLNQWNLERLPIAFKVPGYDRDRLTAGILHIGLSGFQRSHEAVYTDDYLEASGNLEWGICGVGLNESDRKIADVLQRQDFLYTLVTRHPDGEVHYRVIGSLVDYLLAEDDPEAVLARMSDESIRIVSLSVAEAGDGVGVTGDELDLDRDEVRHDLARPAKPLTIFGYLAEALRRRRDAGVPPFTIQSCDHVEQNGAMIRRLLLSFVSRQDPGLAEWIAAEVAFPNSMMDRITPVTTSADIAELEQLGVKDHWPVCCEPFAQWVSEDDFSLGRPAWEKVGARFAADVRDEETMKLRLLNGGHLVLGHLGRLHGYGTTDECLRDELFTAYLQRFLEKEVTPILARLSDGEVAAYREAVMERFRNPALRDQLVRICSESSTKLARFLVPTIQDNLAAGGSVRLAALVVAAWCYRLSRQVTEESSAVEAGDVLQDELQAAAAGTRGDALALLRVRSVFGDLVEKDAFVEAYQELVTKLFEGRGIRELMEAELAAGASL